MQSFGLDIIEGEFAVNKDQCYRIKSYANELELFTLEDKELERPLRRISKEEAQDTFLLDTRGYRNGVEYIVRKMKEEMVVYERAVCDKELHTKPKEAFDIIIRFANHPNCRRISEILYQSEASIKREQETGEKTYIEGWLYLEEMHNGHLMLSYLEEDINTTASGNMLELLYGERLQRYIGFDPNTLLFDYYIENFTIDGIPFCMDADWGIVSISPNDNRGDSYIREICDYFNQIKFMSE